MEKSEKNQGEERKMRTIRMTESDWRSIRVAAAERGTTASELIRAVMLDFIKENKK